MGLFLLGGLIVVWIALLAIVIGVCRAAAQGDTTLVAGAPPRACEGRRRRALAQALSRVR